MEKIKICVIGSGNVGNFIKRQLSSTSIHFKMISIRKNNNNTYTTNNNVFFSLQQSNVIFITTPDSIIADIDSYIAEKLGDNLCGKIVVHCSGANNKEILSACRCKGARIVAAHPFTTITDTSDGKNVIWGIDCDEHDFNNVNKLITLLNGVAVRLSDEINEKRGIYHAVAVVASNYIAGCIKLAINMCDIINLDANQFLPGIINQTIENCINSLEKDKNPLIITGPLARGDASTIEQHLTGMRNHPDLITPYRLFGQGLLEILKNDNKITEENYLSMKKLLKGGNGTE